MGEVKDKLKKIFGKKNLVIGLALVCLCFIGYNIGLKINHIVTQPAGHLIVARSGHHAVLLNDGRIYIVGGDETNRSAEIYDPKTKKSKLVASLPEQLHDQEFSATALKNGKILIAGGRHSIPGASYIPYSKTAYIYDPVKDVFEPALSMTDTHMEHKAVLLNDGNILIIGGNHSSIIDLYNSKTNKFINYGKYCTPKEIESNKDINLARQGVILLNNDNILVVGGGECNISHSYSAQAKIIDTKNNTASPTSNLYVNRGYPKITLLNDGNVLVSGGTNEVSYVTELEIYDALKRTFSIAGNMDKRRGYTTSLISNGKVIFAGGVSGIAQTLHDLSSIYAYNPSDKSYKFFGNMRKIRVGHTATTLNDGSIVFIGGTKDKLIEVYKSTGKE